MPSDIELLKSKAIEIATSYTALCNEKFKISLPLPPNVEFELEHTNPKWAGAAYQKDRKIVLNTCMLVEGTTHIFNDTIPHEIAHLAVSEKFGIGTTKDHGFEWAEVMRQLGLPPSKYHKLSVASAIEAHKKYKAGIKKTKKNS